MKLKVKTNLKALYKAIDDINDAFQNELKTGDLGDQMIDSIVQLIRKGVSPVEGEGRFVRYSKSYKEKIEKGQVKGKDKPRPVNLTQTGDMLGSMKMETIGGRLYLTIKDKKAPWHQFGTKKMPARKMLPVKKGEMFTLRIQQIVVKALKKASKKRKQK